MNKTYVAVDCVRSRDGTEKPSVIYWPDGHFWKIDRVLYASEPNGHEFEGIRYTILIGSAEKYIYRDDAGWYVIPVISGGFMKNERNAVKQRSG